jgi:dihydropteroate synthase
MNDGGSGAGRGQWPDEGARLYLRPVAVLRGKAAQRMVDAGRACWIAGGPMAALTFELTSRSDGHVERRVAPVADLEEWIRNDHRPGVNRIRELLERVRSARPGLSDAPRLMGVVNVTPDSFSDGGLFLDSASALAQCEALLAGGAHMLDIGGESTRPGALPVPVEVELGRVRPVLDALQQRRPTMPGVEVSIDTRHAEVMRYALATGVDVINDVSALTGDPDSLAVAAASTARIVLMHMQGTPQTMNVAPAYEDVVLDVYDYLEARIDACVAAGIERSRLIVDPGIGFGKRSPQNLELLRHVGIFHGLGCPILLGMSRKGLGSGLESMPPDQRVPASLAAAMHALSAGVQILRVHDVAATRQVIELWRRLETA